MKSLKPDSSACSTRVAKLKRGRVSPKRKRFTLIELLVVVAVIAILMGILLPVVGKIRVRGKISKAQSEINAILTAVKSYESTYGLLPIINNTTKIGGDVAEDEYDVLMMFLTKVSTDPAPISVGGESLDQDDGNARNITFLDCPASFTDTIVDTPGSEAGSFRDPWGKRYVVIMDTDYDNEIAGVCDVDNDGSVDGTDILHGSVFVYSLGPPNSGQQYPSDENGKVWQSENGDIASWH